MVLVLGVEVLFLRLPALGWLRRLGDCGVLDSTANSRSQGIDVSSGAGLLGPPLFLAGWVNLQPLHGLGLYPPLLTVLLMVTTVILLVTSSYPHGTTGVDSLALLGFLGFIVIIFILFGCLAFLGGIMMFD